MAPAPVLSTDEYLKTPETLNPTEVIYGALRVAEAPTVRHQQAVGAFHLALAPHVRARRLGRVLLSPIDVIFDWDRALILQPDLIFVSRERWKTRQQRIVSVPDLVLEVLSPDPRIGKLEERIEVFAEYGVSEMWLLHQQRERLDVLRTAGGRIASRETIDYLTPIASDVLPDFRLTVREVLEE